MRHAARLALALTAALAAGCAKKEAGPVTADASAPHPGASVYAKACAECHEGGVARAPHKMFLEMMPTDGILKALEQGVMQTQAAGLTAAERRAVAEYLTGHSLDEVIARTPPPSCEGPRREFDLGRPPAKAGWGVSRENQRFIPADVARLTAADLPKLELKWAFAFPGAHRARSQPTVAMGAVFVGSQDCTVYALDKVTGCVRWTFRASA